MAWPVLFLAGLTIPVVLSGADSAANDDFSAAIPVLLAAAAVYRVGWLSLRGSADGLVIRNYFATRRIPIAQVVAFDVGPSSGGGCGVRTVRVVTSARAIPIDVYTLRFPWIRVATAARLNRTAAELTAWAREVQSGQDGTSARAAVDPAAADAD
jgi:hypothetical protein